MSNLVHLLEMVSGARDQDFTKFLGIQLQIPLRRIEEPSFSPSIEPTLEFYVLNRIVSEEYQ